MNEKFKFPETDEEVEAFMANAPKVEVPEKYQNCDWLWVYGKIGLKAEHIKRLNNAINLLESLNEHTDAKYLKEIKDKLLADAPMQQEKATLRREYYKEERKLK